jgi:hypothetical protein
MATLNENHLTDIALTEFKKNTPVKTGNAKANTSKKVNEIIADYPYATVLDKGRYFENNRYYGSEQAPKGMTEPTIKKVREYVKKKTGIDIER